MSGDGLAKSSVDVRENVLDEGRVGPETEGLAAASIGFCEVVAVELEDAKVCVDVCIHVWIRVWGEDGESGVESCLYDRAGRFGTLVDPVCDESSHHVALGALLAGRVWVVCELGEQGECSCSFVLLQRLVSRSELCSPRGGGVGHCCGRGRGGGRGRSEGVEGEGGGG